MATRSRARRTREPAREPAIWRGALTSTHEIERPAVAQVSRGRSFASWRLVSGLIVVSLAIVLVIFFSSDAFFVHSISVGGLETMTDSEIFTLSGIANMHVFWVDPVEVRRRLLESPTISDAQVTVAWNQPMVSISILERAPALAWEQSGVMVWIDLQGRVMRQRSNRTDLLRVQADPIMEGPATSSIDPEVVNGALQLHQLLPELQVLRYHPDKGLGYVAGSGWEVWLGTGTDMPEKVLIYNAIVSNLQSRGILPGEINVTDPDAPFYSVVSGR